VATSFTHREVDGSIVLACLAAAGLEVGFPERAATTLLDTHDRRLGKRGLRLEHRSAPAAELVLTERGSTAHLPADEPARWPGELPAGPFRARLAEVTKERTLLPGATLRSLRTQARRVDKRGTTTALVELHEDLALDPGPVGELPRWVATVIPVTGHADEAELTVSRLSAVGLDATDDDLLELVARASGAPLAGRADPPRVALHADEDALAAACAVLGALAETIATNLPGTLQQLDTEFLHDLRVAIRQTRSVLRELEGVLPDDVRDAHRELFGELAAATSDPRDLGVHVLGWDASIASLPAEDRAALEPVRKELARRQAAAHRELNQVLRAKATTSALTAWRRWLADPGEAPEGGRTIGEVVGRRLERLHQRLVRDGRAIDEGSPPERLHELRKDAKRLRYVLDGFGGLYPGGPRKSYLGHLKQLQDNLGAHQDAEVQVGFLRELAADLNTGSTRGTAAVLALGRLIDLTDQRRAAERAEFGERFAAYDRKKVARQLDEMVSS
jgi:CHAD domain-containing protein